MAVFELRTIDGQTITFQHEADSLAALLRVFVASQFVMAEKVSSTRAHETKEAVPFGITFHSVAQVRMKPEPDANWDRELIEHHALDEYRERG